jgi:hypothetical protein
MARFVDSCFSSLIGQLMALLELSDITLFVCNILRLCPNEVLEGP